MPKSLALRVRSFSFSPVSLGGTFVAILGVTYIALIAVVMSYAALTVEFSQSVRDDGAAVSTLESRYLDTIASITDTDYTTAGYVKPTVFVYVPKASATALR